MGFRELPYESQKSLHIHSALFWVSLKFNFKAAPCYVYGLASLTFIHFSLLIWQVTISCNSSRSCFHPPPPPFLNPSDSHCNLVINVFSDKKKTQPLLFPAFISLSPLCLIAVENQNAVPMTTVSNESRLIALSVDTCGASRWLCLSFDLTSFRPH